MFSTQTELTSAHLRCVCFNENESKIKNKKSINLKFILKRYRRRSVGDMRAFHVVILVHVPHTQPKQIYWPCIFGKLCTLEARLKRMPNKSDLDKSANAIKINKSISCLLCEGDAFIRSKIWFIALCVSRRRKWATCRTKFACIVKRRREVRHF